MTGPLAGLTIIEMAGLGPGPFAATMLADHGARVIRVERPGNLSIPNDPMTRSRESVAIDLKADAGRDLVRRLAAMADGIIEGYRPGVMEKLGLGPEALQAANPRLVYGRVTGWGQEGPLANRAGHDIDYLALTGLLSAIGEPDRPPRAPLNLLADYAGGGMMLAFGMLAALLEVQRSAGGSRGRIVDAAMTDGAAMIGAIIYGFEAAGLWRGGRGGNMLDGGDPLYGCYACADGKALALGAIEPQFRRALLEGLGLSGAPDHAAVGQAVASRTRDEWVARFAGTDACVAPVLDLAEAPLHPHNAARGTFIDVGGVTQPAPAPRYVGAPASHPRPPREPGADGVAICCELGLEPEEIEALQGQGVLL